MIIKAKQLRDGDTFKMVDGEFPFDETPTSKTRNRTVRFVESFKPNTVTVTTTYCGFAYTFADDQKVELVS